LANGAAEFSKICRGKLWALLVTHPITTNVTSTCTLVTLYQHRITNL